MRRLKGLGLDRIAIEGGARLEGEIAISGAKNSAIKLMAASLLTSEPLRLTTLPRLADTRVLGQLLGRLGTEVQEQDGPEGPETLLHTPEIISAIAPYDLVRQMRASFNVLGPLLARSGQAKVSLPGGCTIGARPVDLHLEALRALGAEIDLHEGYVYAQAPRGLRGAEIVDLADCLNKMGARIVGAGLDVIRIQGVSRLGGTSHAVIPDRIETGTFALAAAMAGGEVRLTHTRNDFIGHLLDKMEEAGVEVVRHNDGVTVKRNGRRLNAVAVETDPYPGFATDLQAQFMALMTLADGESVIRETIFENRFMHAPELARLGADISIQGGEARVRGVSALTGAQVMATDLRASVGLVIAGLAAKGETVVGRVYHLDRGFERLEAKLSACGAKIQRLKGEATSEDAAFDA